MSSKYHFIITLILITPLLLACSRGSIESEQKITRYLQDTPFKMEKILVPEFPDIEFRITEYGAVADGHTLNTDAINSAITSCSESGGGKVIIPPGFWLTGPIKLKSNTNLVVERGAVLQFSGDFGQYPLIESFWNGLPMIRCTSPISGKDLENVAITGEGVIDGSGGAWRPVKKWKMTDLHWEALVNSGGVVREWKNTPSWFPTDEAFSGEALVKELEKRDSVTIDDYEAAHDYLRPVMVQLVNCKNILLDGPAFQNSPNWNIHLLLSENIVVRNISARNPWNAQNGDGLDLESCKNALVYNSTFDVGDDAVCIKSGRNEYGRKRGVPSENIVIKDCIVYNGHNGFSIGSEMSGGVRNVFVGQCQFLGTKGGIRIKTNRERGGIVENIFIDNILMKDIRDKAIWIDMYYQKKTWNKFNAVSDEVPYEAQPVTEATPLFKGISIKNIICNGAKHAMVIEGLPEMPVRDIELKNLNITCAEGVFGADIDGIEITDSRITPSTGPALSILNVRNAGFENFVMPEGNNKFLHISGAGSKNLRIIGYSKMDLNKLIDIGEGVSAESLIIEKK